MAEMMDELDIDVKQTFGFGSVLKESWFGGVLDAHLSDRRSLEDQIVSIFKPWTWGRSGDGGETEVQSSWSDGEMAP